MSEHIALQATSELLQQEFGMQVPSHITAEAIIEQLAIRVAQLIDKGPDAFFQMMYRLDISERKLNALRGQPDMALGIATLIYERQLQKIKSREHFRQHNNDTDPDLKW